MKQLLRSLTYFTRVQRVGIIVLSVVIITLLGIRIYLNYLPAPTADIAANKRLNDAYTDFVASQPHPDTVEQDYADRPYNTEATALLPDTININTADSAVLVRLKGIGPATVDKILARRKRKPFGKVDELLDLQPIPAAKWALIKPHLTTGRPIKQ